MKKSYLLSLVFAFFITAGFVSAIPSDSLIDKLDKTPPIELSLKTIELKKDHSNVYAFSFINTAYADETAPAVEGATAATGVAAEADPTVPTLPGSDDPDLSEELPLGDFLKAVTASLGSWKGLGMLGIAALVVQLLMLLFRTTLMNWAAKWRLLLVYVLSIGAGYMALMVAGASWSEALLNSNTLAAVQVFVN